MPASPPVVHVSARRCLVWGSQQIKALLGFGQPDDAAWLAAYTTTRENAAVRNTVVRAPAGVRSLTATLDGMVLVIACARGVQGGMPRVGRHAVSWTVCACCAG
jgi:hypothetical protein